MIFVSADAFFQFLPKLVKIVQKKYRNNHVGKDKVVSTIDKKFAHNAINEIKKKAWFVLQKEVKPVIS